MVAASMHAAAASARLGEPEPAVRTLLELLQIWRRAGAEAFRPVFLRWLAEAYAASGDRSAALAVLDEGIAHVQKFGGAVHRAELHRTRGRVLRDLGRGGEAVDEFRRAARLAANQEARSYELRARIDLVETLPRRESDAERRALKRLVDTFPATLHDADLMLARELGADG
jgi:tetratricopeptide (TPR) repeat protein